MVKQDVDQEHVVAVLNLMFNPGDVIEVRVLDVPRAGVVSGYFDDFPLAAKSAARYTARASGIYFTLNPVNSALLARSANRLTEWAKNLTSDADIPARRFILLDFDPMRPSGISSTDDELAAAVNRRDEVRAWLEESAGFPAGLVGMSGNGGHLLYRLPDLPNTQEITDLIQACILAVKSRFDDGVVGVDNTVFNASRIVKLYGTWARKGDDVPGRPHRLSRLDLLAVPPEPVCLDLLRWLAVQCPPEEVLGSSGGPAHGCTRLYSERMSVFSPGRRLDVPAYLAAAGIEYRVRQKGGVTWYNFKDCPVHNDPDGDRYECGVCQFESGAMGAKCQHDPKLGWADFKVVLGDPSPYYDGGATLQAKSARGMSPARATPVIVVNYPSHPAASSQMPAGETETLTKLPVSALDQVIAYARCPMEYLLRYQAGVQTSTSGKALVEQVVREALRAFHSGAEPTPFIAVRMKWLALLKEWRIEAPSDAYAALEKYARLRTELLLPFLRGEIVRSDGSRYLAPRNSRTFQQMAGVRGLLQLKVKVEEQIPQPPTGVPISTDIVVEEGESISDVFADTVEIALRYKEPIVEELVGLNVPFDVSLPGESHLSGQADLVARVQERSEPGMSAVVHDFSDRAATWDVLLHDLRVVALLSAGREFWQGEGFRRVDVHYLRTGEVVSIYGSSTPPWGMALLSAAMRAMNVPGAPRMAIAAQQCANCSYWAVCVSLDGWNVLANGH